MKLKKIVLSIISILLTLTLFGCSSKIDNPSSTTENPIPTTTTTSTTTATTTNIVVDYDYTFDYKSINKNQFRYTTGNYFDYTISKIKLGIYRGIRTVNTDLVDLLSIPDFKGYTSVEPIESAIYNVTEFSAISYISITYRCNGNAALYYSNDKSDSNKTVLDKQISLDEKVFAINDAKYFKITAENDDLYINSIKIKLSNETKTSEILTYDGYRVNPISYDDNLISGVTKRSIPVKVEKDGNSYKVLETKEYTYYNQNDAFEYLMAHGKDSLYDQMVYTDPIDVANYYILFNVWPINYIDKDDAMYTYTDSSFSFMKDDIRCVSEYSRVDGYVLSVPLNLNNGRILYYELDLALDESYYPGSRGVGRLVVFTNGFDEEGYDNAPVIIYTDDHYATFMEYNNCGSFNERFNAERARTPYDWCNTETITLQE